MRLKCLFEWVTSMASDVVIAHALNTNTKRILESSNAHTNNCSTGRMLFIKRDA